MNGAMYGTGGTNQCPNSQSLYFYKVQDRREKVFGDKASNMLNYNNFDGKVIKL